MKTLLRILLPLAVVAVALTACGPDKPKNNPEIEKYVKAHPYVAALADEAPILFKFHPLAIFNKTGLVADPDFEAFREGFFEDFDPVERMMVMNSLQDFSVMGLDPDNPFYVSMSGIEFQYPDYADIDKDYYRPDVSADLYGVVPLTDRSKLVNYIQMADEDFKADEDGNYLYATEDGGILITEKAVIAYLGLNRNLTEPQVKERLLAAAAKTSFIHNQPGADAFFTRPDDIALWCNNESMSTLMELGADQWLDDETGIDLQTLLGDNLATGTAALLSSVSEPGALVLRGETFGTNPMADRFLSWIGEPKREMLEYLPTDAQVAFTFSFQNLSDALSYAQEVLERSGEADGINLQSVIGAFGVEPKDLDGIGTMVAGVKIGDGTIDWIVALELGDKLLSTAQMGLSFADLAEDPDYPGCYLAGDDICVRLIDGIAFAGSCYLIHKIGPGTLFEEYFLEQNPLADYMGYLAVKVDDPLLYAPFEDEDVTRAGEILAKNFSVLQLAKEPGHKAVALKLYTKNGCQGAKAFVSALIDGWDDFDKPTLFPILEMDGDEEEAFFEDEDDDYDYDYLY